MKKIALIAATTIALFSCTKGDDPTAISTITTRINGAQWRANEITWSNVNNMLQIEGKNGTTYVRLSIPNYSGAKTYALGTSLYGAAYMEGSATYAAKDGHITITSDDAKAIKGTFTFNASTNNTSRKLENGVFTLNK